LRQFAIEERHETKPKRTSGRILYLATAQEFLMRPAQQFSPLCFSTDQTRNLRKFLQVCRLKRRLAIRI
jgi:hypothetical protein